jgi:hypothetical protein
MAVRSPEVWAAGSANQEAWFFNGLPLQSAYGAWNIATFGGSRFGVPVFRGQNYQTPYRAGQNQRAKMPDSRTITMNFWVDGQGQHSTSSYPAADQRLAFNSNFQQLRAAFFQMTAAGSAQGQLQRTWYITQSGSAKLVQATAMAELAGSLDLTMNGRTNAAFSADFLLADPFFYGAQVIKACTGASTAVTGLGEGVAGLGYPSPVAGFTVSCSAAGTVTNTTAGVSFTLASGPSYPVTVDVLNGTVTDNAGANQIAAITHSGARAWMVVLPGTNTISVSAGTATFTYNDAYI